MTVVPPTSPRIFVSHSSKDNEFGVQLVQDLRRKLGSEDAVWYDSHGGLFGGDAWFDIIKKELTARHVFIVVLSPDALDSKWVQDEIRMAWRQRNEPGGKHIIPILYRECEVPEELKTVQMISFLPPESYDNAFPKLYEALFRRRPSPITWSDLCNSCKNITQKGMSRLKQYQLEKLYVQRKNVHDQFMHFLADPETRCFVLIGKSGAGKSSFLRSLAEEMQAKERQSQDDQNILLLYDEGLYRDVPFMKAVNEDFSHELRRRVENIWQEIAEIDEINEHMLLLCIDAVNENERAIELVKQVNMLIGKDWPWLKVLLISRPETWRMIKQGIKLADSLYYRGEEDVTSGAIKPLFSYSMLMKPFSLEELPQAYAKYEREYQMRTPYKALPAKLREIISDPFNLWLVAEAHREKAIPSNLRVSDLIEQYVKALINGGKLQRGDQLFLEDDLVPLMAREDHPLSNTITAADLKAADSTLYDKVYNHQPLSDGRRANEPLLRLCDADILMLQEQGTEQRIKFKYERFYEYFVGKRIASLSETQPDRYAFFRKLIEEITGKEITGKKKTPGKPFLWGAVRNALVEEAKKPNSETILRLCQMAEPHVKEMMAAEQHVKEMMANVLITLGLDDPEQVEEILGSLVPEEKKPSGVQKIRQVVGKSAERADLRTINARKIAIEVASNLKLGRILQTEAMQADSTLRTEAVRYSYYLWQRDQAAGFTVLEYIAEKATTGIIPNFAAFESVLGLSMIIFCDHYQDKEVLGKLQGIWRGMIATLFRVHEGSSPWDVARDFLRERIIAFAIGVVFGLIRQFPASYSIVNYEALEAFFRLKTDKKALYRNLVHYLDIDGPYSREQMERDYLTALTIDNVLVSLTTLMGLVAHACSAPLAFLPFLKQLFEEAKRDVATYPYLTVIANVAMEVLYRDPMNDEMFAFFVYTAGICQEYYAKHPETYHSRLAEAPQAAALAPYILFQYRRAGTIKTEWLETRIQAALSQPHLKLKLKFFEFLLTSELPQVGIENREPRAALAVLELFFQSGNAEITHMIQAFLSRLRIYYPDEVDDFLEEQQALDEFRLQVRTNEPAEKVGDLVGKRSWFFIRDSVLLGSSELRSQLIVLFEKAAECKDMQAWVEYIIRQLVNLIYGGQVLRPSR